MDCPCQNSLLRLRKSDTTLFESNLMIRVIVRWVCSNPEALAVPPNRTIVQ